MRRGKDNVKRDDLLTLEATKGTKKKMMKNYKGVSLTTLVTVLVNAGILLLAVARRRSIDAPATIPDFDARIHAHLRVPVDFRRAYVFFYKSQARNIPAAVKLNLRGGFEENETSIESSKSLNEIRSAQLCDEAWQIQGEGQVEEAIRLLKEALVEDPKNTEAISKLGMIYEYELEDYKVANTLYQKGLSIQPNSSTLLYDYAVFLQERIKDLDGAEEYYKRALTLNPFDPNILNNYAVFLKERRNDTQRADAVFRQSIEISPNSTSSLCNYATFLESSLGKFDEAEKMYKRALEIEPDDESTLYNYAIFLEEVRGDIDGAENMYRRVLQIEPTDSDALNNLALILQNSRALSACPEDLSTVNNMAVLYEDCLAQPEEAEKWYKRALQARSIDNLMANRLIEAQESKEGDLPIANTTGPRKMIKSELRQSRDPTETLRNLPLAAKPYELAAESLGATSNSSKPSLNRIH
eukprot:762098-Hanusia_phi.AAC.3